MLKAITLRNFKPFGGTHRIPLSKINLIYGPNSAGKSSIIQALLLLKQSYDNSHRSTEALDLITRGRLTDLGSFLTLVHKHEKDLDLGIGITFGPFSRRRQGRHNRTLQGYLNPLGRGRIDENSNLTIAVSYEAASTDDRDARDSPFLSAVRYESHEESGSQSFGVSRSSPGEMDFAWEGEQDRYSYADFLMGARIFSPSRDVGFSTGELSEALRGSRIRVNTGLPNIVELSPRSTFEKLLVRARARRTQSGERWPALERLRRAPEPLISSPLLNATRDFFLLLDSIAYLGPMRSHPERIYAISDGSRETVGTRGEYTQHILFYDPSSIEAANSLFREFEIPYRLEINTLGDANTGEFVTITLIDSRTRTRVTPVDVGYGINQLMPVLVEGVSAQSEVVCVEQPELHLHPRLQAAISDMMIKTAKRANHPKQWIVETHSELVIRRILRRISEGRNKEDENCLRPSDVSVIYVDPRQESGSLVEILRIDDDGTFIDDWPQGFFVEAFNEVMGV